MIFCAATHVTPDPPRHVGWDATASCLHTCIDKQIQTLAGSTLEEGL